MNWNELEREQRRINQALEAGMRAKGAEYEQYLLADAYHRAAMRRKAREEASRQGPQRVSKTSDLTNQRKISAIQPGARTAP